LIPASNHSDGPVTDTKLILRPLIGLMDRQTPEQVEQHLVREMEKHRRLRDEAVVLEAHADETSAEDDGGQADAAYITAMIAVHAQQTVVSTLLDILGYLPATPKSEIH
jgi:hypothetical protein